MSAARRIDVAHDGVPEPPQRQGKAKPVQLWRLWLGLLLAPTMWVIAELVGYYFAARSCEPSRGIPFAGTGDAALTHIVVQGVAAIIAAGGLGIALRNWRDSRSVAGPDGVAMQRAEFMAYTGVVLSALFVFGILMFQLPGFVVDACSQVR